MTGRLVGNHADARDRKNLSEASLLARLAQRADHPKFWYLPCSLIRSDPPPCTIQARSASNFARNADHPKKTSRCCFTVRYQEISGFLLCKHLFFFSVLFTLPVASYTTTH